MKKIKIIISCLAIAFFATCHCTQLAFAKSAGDQGFQPGKGCELGVVGGQYNYNNPSVGWGDSCNGVGWRYYKLDEEGLQKLREMGANVVNKNKIILPSLCKNGSISADEHAPCANAGGIQAQGATISGCKDMGGFYNLGFERYNGGKFLNMQFGTVNANVGRPPYGVGHFPGGSPTTSLKGTNNGSYGLDGIESWKSVERNFRKAQKNDTNNNLNDWSNTGWFCYEKDPTPFICDPHDDSEENEECQPREDTEYLEGAFNATTTVHIDPQNGDVPEYTKVTDYNKTATIAFSTKASSVNVKFWHNIYYGDNLWKPQNDNKSWEDIDNTYNKICAKVTVTKQLKNYKPKTGRFALSTLAENEDFCTDGDGKKNGAIYQPQTHNVSLRPGQTKIVCQKLKMKNTKWEITERTVEYPDESSWDKDQEMYTNWLSYKEWNASIQDRKQVDTSACAMITRPYTMEDSDDPQTPEDPSNPDSPYLSDEVYSKSEIDGKNGTNTLYVGEDASAYWVTDAPYYPTHRITEYQHILYGVSVGVPYSPDIIKKLVDSKDDPCTTAYNSRAAQSCNKKHSEENIDTKIGPSWDTQNWPNFSDLVVPDGALGDKYCTSGGVKYQYYIGEINSRDFSNLNGFTWTPLDNSYWNIMKSSCKPLAKKPSVAFWNGSLYTSGGINTLAADRFTNASEWFKDASTGGERKLYGSWSEHIAAIGGTTKNFASGSSLAIGSKFNTSSNFLENSTLTIANNNSESLGNSGIEVSTAIEQLRDRMLGDDKPVEETSSIGGISVSGTKVYHASSDLEITGDIENNGTYNSISAIPQVLIFLEGEHEIKISKDVRKIDAWIIAPNGTIDTCVDFQNGGTEARGDCNQRLIFNGPVVAKNIKLNRSHGSEGGSNKNRALPAEVFNYRADAYLWAYAQSGKYGTTLNEVYMSELAPRY